MNRDIHGRRPRDASIDLYKALLIVAMIFSHTIGVLGDRSIPVLESTKRFVELLAFPGFLLCFGYTAQLAYFSQRPLMYKRILVASVKLLIAFYISAISYELLINTDYVTLSKLGATLTLSNISPVSEFILNFPLTLLLATVLITPLNWILQSPVRVIVTVCALLGTTLIPYELITSPQLGLLIGAPRTVFSAFPVLQYFPFFLIGMYFAREKISYSRRLMVASLVAAGLYLIYQRSIAAPVRFPPSLAWIGGSLAFALSGYFVVHYFPANSRAGRILLPIGVNSLNFFLLSNILLFAVGGAFPKLGAGPALCFLIALAVTGIIYFVMMNTRRDNQGQRAMASVSAPLVQAALPPAQEQILGCLKRGDVLKVQRHLDGRKDFTLCTLEGAINVVPRDTVEPLIEWGLIDSNKKFPAATYWLTDRGLAHLGLT